MVKPPWVKGGESALIARLQSGERLAWDAFMKEHRNLIYGLCLRTLRNTQDAEDVCQEVFLRAAKGIGRFRGDSSLGAWLGAIALNRCRSLRGKRRIVVDEGWIADLPDEGPTAEAALVAREKRIALERAIGQLPEDFRATVVLLAQGRSYSEIATILGVSIGTVKSRISRASARLLVLLAEFRP